MCVLSWRSQQKVSNEETHKGAETCLPDASAFPGTATGALEMLVNTTPLVEFLLAEAVRWSYRIAVSGLWQVNPFGSFGKTKSHVDFGNEAEDSYLCCKCLLTEKRK